MHKDNKKYVIKLKFVNPANFYYLYPVMAMTQNYKARILKASAGSGKTYSLAREYIYNTLRNQPGETDADFNPNVYRTILAVTFTNKATEEMKSRILKQINLLATGGECEFLDDLIAMTSLSERVLRQRALRVRSAILHDYSRFSILTNDTFFQRIVRAFAKELNIDMDYAIELDTAPVVQKSVDMLIERAEKDQFLQQWLTDFAEENIENGRQWNIKRVILRLKNELFKEHAKSTIGREIDKEQLQQVVMEYISSARELVERVQQLAQRAVDMIEGAGYSHSIFSGSFTRYFDKVARFDSKTTAPTDTFVKHCTDEPRKWYTQKTKVSPDMLSLAAALQPLAAEIVERFEDTMYLCNSIALLEKNYRSFALMYDLYSMVAEICKEQNTMLLAQTKHTIAQFVREPSDAPFIYEKVGNLFEKFMIDEFQDTSLMEWQNFLPMLRNAISQSEDVAVLLVGDIKQSIYRWRGSDWNILGVKAPAALSENGTAVQQSNLEDNYRSQPNIVRFNNVAISLAARRLNRGLNELLLSARAKSYISDQVLSELYDAVGDAYCWPQLRQIPKRKPRRSGYVRVTAHRDKEPDVIGCIRTLVHEKHYKPCDITVLVRTNDEAERIASMLLDAGAADESMRFGIMTQEALKINSSVVVRFALAVMKYAIDRKDVVSLATYNRYHHNFNIYHRLSADELAFFDSIKTLSPEEAFERIMVRFPEIFKGQAVYTDAFHEHIVKFCATKVADLSLFVKWWDENGYNKSVSIDKDTNAIEIMTVHKAKGLENKVVIIPYCSWKFVPEPTRAATVWTMPAEGSNLNTDTLFPVVATADAGKSIFSEGYYRELIYDYVDAINLLYVAFTRPKEQLHIFFPAPKSTGNGALESSVGELIYKVLGMRPQLNEDGVVDEDAPIVYQYGECAPPLDYTKTQECTVVLENNVVSPFKMKLKLSSERYMEARRGGKVTPQQEGILLHGIMERAATREDIDRELARLSYDGVLSESESKLLQQQIDTMFAMPLVAQWFSKSWDEVYTENAIIMTDAKTKRPDRVMTVGDKAVVVDYKFGEQSEDNRRQIAQYAQLLETMGYRDVEGYIWYVREGVIDRVL